MKAGTTRSVRDRVVLYTLRLGLSCVLFLLAVWRLPYWCCSRPADRWYDGDAQLQTALASGVERWVTNDLSRGQFSTGSSQFNGEWLFGTYLMAGLGFGQTALEHPELKARNVKLMEQCITLILSDGVRQFDTESWGNDAITTLDDPAAHHAAYLGYLNLLLGFHRQLAPDSPFASLNDRITDALHRRVTQSPIRLLQTYPGEVYPVDNCAVMGSIGLHAKVTDTDRGAFLKEWIAFCRQHYVDRETGLLIQCVDSRTGAPADDPRGSGTFLGLYFLSFADPAFAGELYRAGRRNLSARVLGFGGAREYPRNVAGGMGDIDSGPVIAGLGLSSTGFMIAGSRMAGDRDYFRRLYATAHAWGAPYERDDQLTFVTGGPLGNAILFAMLTAQPWEGPR